jgi:L,D-peptidoglycan transpeptidase YkuD (ErfK/YbiS/YcfS/YnhG family)
MASSPPRPIRSREITSLSYFVKMPDIITVRRRPGERSKGTLLIGNWRCPCALGKGGVSACKREGDGASPRGRFLLRRVWLRPSKLRPAALRLPVRLTRPGDGWCDDARHPRYNRPVVLPFPASHERMWRDDALYDAVVEIGWNDRPAIRGRGSAIFLHLARPGYAPTEGCVAIRAADMRRLLPMLTPRTRIDIK